MRDHSQETRHVYHQQHLRVSQDSTTMERFISMFTLEYFGLEPGYFQKKRVLDAGCGDTAKLIIALYRLGARDISAFDLGEDFIPVVRANLDRYGVPQELVRVASGNILSIPFSDQEFDFVACHGVMVHLNTYAEVERGFAELARVTKPGGLLYTVLGEEGGLWRDCLYPALRKYYLENEAFRGFVDNTTPEDIARIIDFVEEKMRELEGSDVNLSFLKPLLDLDLLVTLQNICQAPVRIPVSEKQHIGMYLDNGFETPQRLRRFIKRKNIRRYFAPLHYHYDHPLSRLLYGGGCLEFIARKKGDGRHTPDRDTF
ncbi:class I SAM-dependent methyltransferase [Desulfolutivibrio sulfoxidireducens]|uniref:class I SAM-dependent methyltransferase n=1 Tax=Desulfolutivibrio sulfoxidireducens TaxID=2773299 RepID=UPI00159D1693|nr:class I SAM-dependent methyltransferase [Desulfolutivibrio sulfoxidireducens]QLA17051.1 methyltransferase domain-containing protein [Desulfolutivibrio sulfoxidireducens]